MTDRRIPFASLTPGEDEHAIRTAIDRVLRSGWFILGPEVAAFEAAFAAASGARHAIGVGNGTDAIALTLRALGIGPGDEVITTPLSAAYTALAVLMVGARPVFADIDPERLTLDAEQAGRAVSPRTKAILPVHLYGQAGDMAAIERVASRHGLAIVEDCCQAHLATAAGRPVGTLGMAGAFSFYPTKNLGALGDAGAIITNDDGLADRLRRLRNGGQSDRYHHVEAGINTRLDEMQAAILHARLPLLAEWTRRRRALATAYRTLLPTHVVQPLGELDSGHVYHLFVVRVADGAKRRAALQAHLKREGIETLVHYPVPITRQQAFASANPGVCPQADRICDEILSLPLSPSLTTDDVASVAEAIAAFGRVESRVTSRN